MDVTTFNYLWYHHHNQNKSPTLCLDTLYSPIKVQLRFTQVYSQWFELHLGSSKFPIYLTQVEGLDQFITLINANLLFKRMKIFRLLWPYLFSSLKTVQERRYYIISRPFLQTCSSYSAPLMQQKKLLPFSPPQHSKECIRKKGQFPFCAAFRKVARPTHFRATRNNFKKYSR